ncbi:MAG: hypothetical protein ACREMK_11050 [Gemmatimonadota bacterium]
MRIACAGEVGGLWAPAIDSMARSISKTKASAAVSLRSLYQATAEAASSSALG